MKYDFPTAKIVAFTCVDLIERLAIFADSYIADLPTLNIDQ